MNLGAQTGQALGAMGDAFLDGLRLCLIVAAALTLLAALVSVVLLRPRASSAATVTVAAQPVPGSATADAVTPAAGGDPVTVRRPG